jgi:hypothetical protein
MLGKQSRDTGSSRPTNRSRLAPPYGYVALQPVLEFLAIAGFFLIVWMGGLGNRWQRFIDKQTDEAVEYIVHDDPDVDGVPIIIWIAYISFIIGLISSRFGYLAWINEIGYKFGIF